jgi:F0F1-type ATP synthase membrane subunit b/b'
MKAIKLFSICSFLVSISAIANEEAAHHAPSVLDLKYPFVNFIIMLAILSKVVKPLREKFNKEADNIKSLVESAARNNKDAEEKLAASKNKFNNVESDLVKINSEYEQESAQFAKLQSEETQTIIARIKKDHQNRLEGERKELTESINHELLDLVIGKTKTQINSNAGFKSKATSNIVSELR